MKKKEIIKNPYLILSPVLILSISYILIFPTDGKWGDEARYINLAENIIHGYYSPPAPAIDFGNGPGYPLFIAPFIALRTPLVVITILNAVLLYFSLILLYKILFDFLKLHNALIFCLLCVLNINCYQYLDVIVAEKFAFMLISLIVYNLIKSFNPESQSGINKYIVLSGFFIGYLALTKPIFGYVISIMLIFTVILSLINRKSVNYIKGTIILFIAFATVTPYLIYTYSMTGKFFYWSTNGGDNLYWMSTPYLYEYGSCSTFVWFTNDSLSKANYPPDLLEYFRSNHRKVYDEVISIYKGKEFDDALNFTGIERDDALIKIAIDNIKSHPIKFLKNCISNIGRMLFDFPYSYRVESPRLLVKLPINGIIILLIVFSLIPTYINWKRIPFSIRFMLFFALLYFGGSILGSAETRMFTLIIPLVIVWIAFIIKRSLKIKLKFE